MEAWNDASAAGNLDSSAPLAFPFLGAPAANPSNPEAASVQFPALRQRRGSARPSTTEQQTALAVFELYMAQCSQTGGPTGPPAFLKPLRESADDKKVIPSGRTRRSAAAAARTVSPTPSLPSSASISDLEDVMSFRSDQTGGSISSIELPPPVVVKPNLISSSTRSRRGSSSARAPSPDHDLDHGEHLRPPSADRRRSRRDSCASVDSVVSLKSTASAASSAAEPQPPTELKACFAPGHGHGATSAAAARGNRPPRPRNAFILFTDERRKTIRDEYPGIPSTEHQRVMSREWNTKTNEQKQPWVDLATRLREEVRSFQRPLPNRTFLEYTCNRRGSRSALGKRKAGSSSKQSRLEDDWDVVEEGGSSALRSGSPSGSEAETGAPTPPRSARKRPPRRAASASAVSHLGALLDSPSAPGPDDDGSDGDRDWRPEPAARHSGAGPLRSSDRPPRGPPAPARQLPGAREAARSASTSPPQAPQRARGQGADPLNSSAASRRRSASAPSLPPPPPGPVAEPAAAIVKLETPTAGGFLSPAESYEAPGTPALCFYLPAAFGPSGSGSGLSRAPSGVSLTRALSGVSLSGGFELSRAPSSTSQHGFAPPAPASGARAGRQGQEGPAPAGRPAGNPREIPQQMRVPLDASCISFQLLDYPSYIASQPGLPVASSYPAGGLSRQPAAVAQPSSPPAAGLAASSGDRPAPLERARTTRELGLGPIAATDWPLRAAGPPAGQGPPEEETPPRLVKRGAGPPGLRVESPGALEETPAGRGRGSSGADRERERERGSSGSLEGAPSNPFFAGPAAEDGFFPLAPASPAFGLGVPPSPAPGAASPGSGASSVEVTPRGTAAEILFGDGTPLPQLGTFVDSLSVEQSF
eukprot:tig00000923_g5474.t1